MPLTFQEADFDALAGLWNDCYPEAYRITPEVLRANTVDSPVFDWGASSLEYGINGKLAGFVLVKRAAASLYKGPNPDNAHLSAIICPEPGLGVDLMESVKRLLRNRGVYKLIYGQDSRHFFPGCPQDFQSMRDFLTVEGFEEAGEIFDVVRDISTYQPPERAMDPLGRDSTVRRLTQEDVDKLDDFLRREFPGRWHYDAMSKLRAEGRADFIFGLFIGDSLQGFALTQDAGHKVPISGAVFQHDLGDNWAALGPIGVSKNVRGKGFGDALLSASLLELKAKGTKNCVIDWTVLTDWYGKHGFTTLRRYHSCALPLDVL